jgi:photosystem II stability/assembly factor-like uncharacterized protein
MKIVFIIAIVIKSKNEMKKKIFMTLAIIVMASALWSQQWKKNLPQGKSLNELTLMDYEKAFNDFWAPYNVDKGYYILNEKKIKAYGWKQFQRWYYNMEGQVEPSTGKFPKQTAQEVYNQYLKDKTNIISPKSASWTSLGPNSSESGYYGVGRLNCIEFHPSDNNTFWVGAPAGGLWKTTDGGNSWSCLTNNNNVLGISDILVPSDYETTNIIYLATGDKNGWDNNSVGVLKSSDGGQTWNETGISFNIGQGEMVYRLLKDPENDLTILAATSQGLYKTLDGGDTWNILLSSNIFVDVESKPNDFNTLYGSTSNGKIYTSSDGGLSWVLAINTGGYRTEMAVSMNQPNWVYAVVTNYQNGLLGIYKSTDSGLTFSMIYNDKNILCHDSGGNSVGGQGYYDLTITVSPNNANRLFVGGINTWRSYNGGSSWTIVNHWFGNGGAPAVHADKHMLRYRSNGDLFEANDGGIYISSDNGTTWYDKTDGMEISQMYKLSVSANSPSEILTGLQDNGTKLIRNNQWSEIIGGDGMECLIDYSNPLIQYVSFYGGDVRRTDDRWLTSFYAGPAEAGLAAWVNPFIIDPTDPSILYAGYADVWKTTNRGDSWTKISTMNTNDKLRSMAIAPSDNQVLYVADNSQMWKTIDGGDNWTDITGTLPVASGNITYIAIKNDDPQTVWVSLGGYNGNGVYQSIDGGATWENISEGLPQIPMYSIVQNKQVQTEEHLYVGSELGVYFKKGTDNWVQYNTNLPNVKTGEIEIYYDANPTESLVIAATYGRGMWQSRVYDDITPMVYEVSNATQLDTTGVHPATQNVVVIGIEVETVGIVEPISISSLSITMDGTTDISDVNEVKVFYTGPNPNFESNTQFGTATPPSDGAITFNQNQELNTGVNYFWLTYDLIENATIGNQLNATFISATIGDQTHMPVIANPGNGRTIIGVAAIELSETTLDFGNIQVGESSEAQEYSVSAEYLTDELTILTSIGYKVSTSINGSYSNYVYLPTNDGSIDPTIIYVKFVPPYIQGYSGNIRHMSTGVPTIQIAVSGIGTDISNIDDRPFNMSDITVYPNPSHDVFNIENSSQKELEITITDFRGRAIDKKVLESRNSVFIDLSAYPSGIYFARFTLGHRAHSIRLVRE